MEAHQPQASPTSRDTLASLPRRKVRPAAGTEVFSNTPNDLPAACGSGEPCSVCHDSMEEGAEVVELPCQHCYHEDCITAWLKDVSLCSSAKTNSMHATPTWFWSGSVCKTHNTCKACKQTTALHATFPMFISMSCALYPVTACCMLLSVFFHSNKTSTALSIGMRCIHIMATLRSASHPCSYCECIHDHGYINICVRMQLDTHLFISIHLQFLILHCCSSILLAHIFFDRSVCCSTTHVQCAGKSCLWMRSCEISSSILGSKGFRKKCSVSQQDCKAYSAS